MLASAPPPLEPDELELDELACPLLLLLPPLLEVEDELPPLDALLLPPLLLPPEDWEPPPRPSVDTASEHAPRRTVPMAKSQRTEP